MGLFKKITSKETRQKLDFFMSFHDPREGLRPVTKRRCHPLNPVVFVGILDVHNSGVFVLAITECCLGNYLPA